MLSMQRDPMLKTYCRSGLQGRESTLPEIPRRVQRTGTPPILSLPEEYQRDGIQHACGGDARDQVPVLLRLAAPMALLDWVRVEQEKKLPVVRSVDDVRQVLGCLHLLK
jgi:hypothetical protein